MKSDPEHLATLVQKVQRWLICTRWKKGIFGVLSVLKCQYITVQYLCVELYMFVKLLVRIKIHAIITVL